MDQYLWIKALHVISVIAWMAGMLYLPRLFVYHAAAERGSELSETLKVMERRLLRAIVNPAMIASFGFGIWMLVLVPEYLTSTWFLVKAAALLAMGAVHGAFSKWRKEFAEDRNLRPARFYRIANEVPAVLMFVIVLMVILKPA